MKIKFLTDFRGRETQERFYQAGEVVDIDDATAARLVDDKRAEKLPVTVADEKPVAPPAQQKRRGKK